MTGGPKFRPSFIRRWIVTVSAAEALGFAVASAVALAAIIGGLDGAAALVLPVAGGAIEGALLGTGQWLAMGRRRPPAVAWIGATAIGATLAWTLGMLPSTLGADFSTPSAFAVHPDGGDHRDADAVDCPQAVQLRLAVRAW